MKNIGRLDKQTLHIRFPQDYGNEGCEFAWPASSLFRQARKLGGP